MREFEPYRFEVSEYLDRRFRALRREQPLIRGQSDLMDRRREMAGTDEFRVGLELVEKQFERSKGLKTLAR